MTLIEYLVGVEILEFSDEDRGAVYRRLYDERISVISAENLEGSFRIRILRSSSVTLCSRLADANLFPIARREIGGKAFLRHVVSRLGLVFGVVLGLALLLYCRSRVWEIELVGNDSIDPDLLLEELEKCGLYEGMAIRELSENEISLAILSLDSRLAWVQIRRHGVRVIVECLTVKQGNETIDLPKDKGANLVADFDAEIVDILVTSGEACVTPGSVVHAGDLLVSGIGRHGATYADARVIGKVKDTVSVIVSLSCEQIIPTKSKLLGLTLHIFGHTLTFGRTDGSFSERDTLYLFGMIRIPIFWSRHYETAFEKVECEMREVDAARMAERLLTQKLAILLSDGELLTSSVTGNYDQQGYTLTANIEYLINIAKTLEFSLENE